MKNTHKILNLCVLVCISFAVGCAPGTKREPDFSPYFESREVNGAFLLYDSGKDEYIRYGGERCSERFIPASTYKLLHAQIALATGVITDENDVIPWDGTVWYVDAWNQDHNLQTAIEHSVVWFFQELAGRIGQVRAQEYVDSVGYGNQDIGGPEDLYWLEGNLRISQEEQIRFLRQLYNAELPFSEPTMQTIKDIILLEEAPAYRLSGKTGWATHVDPDVGWFIGYVETADNVYFFATNVDQEGSERSLGKISQEITMEILKELEKLK